MRTAHLIITHTSPEQIGRMIGRTAHPAFDFYIHVDKKVDIRPYLYLKKLGNVFFVKRRVAVKWAGYSVTRAVFNGIREICSAGTTYNFINLLSGQDYPLQSPAKLVDFFTENVGKEFMSYADFFTEWEEGQFRYKTYHLSDCHFKGRYFVEQIINGLFPKRALPYGFRPYGKSMFWMLSPEAALFVADSVEKDPTLRRFFSLCWASDEFVFQTVLMNSVYREKVVNNNFRYIDWSVGGPRPKVLQSADFEQIVNDGIRKGQLFGRKFDLSIDAQVLDLIDAGLEESSQSPGR